MSSFRYRYSTTWLYQFLSQRVFTNGGSTTSFINDRNSRASTTTPRRLIDGRPAPDPRAEKWALRLLGLKGFARGIRPTVISSFVGSAVTISEFFEQPMNSASRLGWETGAQADSVSFTQLRSRLHCNCSELKVEVEVEWVRGRRSIRRFRLRPQRHSSPQARITLQIANRFYMGMQPWTVREASGNLADPRTKRSRSHERTISTLNLPYPHRNTKLEPRFLTPTQEQKAYDISSYAASCSSILPAPSLSSC